MKRGGINTVLVDDEYIHITDLDHEQLCTEWAKRQRELKDLYAINSKINKSWFGWKVVLLRLLGVSLQDRSVKFGE